MKNSIFKSLLLFIPVLLMTACESEPILFDSSMKLVGFSSRSLLVNETDGTATINIYLGAEAGATATADLTISTEGLANPAVEGVDFELASSQVALVVGVNEVTLTILDNAVFTGDKQFKIMIGDGAFTTAYDHVLTVTISDDEHPLKKWLGSYTGDAQSYGDPDNWDELWNVTILPVDGDLTKIQMVGIGDDTADPIIATLDTDNMTITIEPGQNLGDAYGYGDTFVFFGYADLTWDEQIPLTGTIDNNGNIFVDNWAHQIDDWCWDVFNVTFSK